MSSFEDNSVSSSIDFETTFEGHTRNNPVCFSHLVSL